MTPDNYLKAIGALQKLLPADNVSIDVEVLKKHGQSFSERDGKCVSLSILSFFDVHVLSGMGYSVVVFPTSTAEVVDVVKVSREHKMPIIAYGGATSLEGHCTVVSRRTFLWSRPY